MADKLTIGFLGAGKMATALAKGVVAAGLVKAANIRASDPAPAALTEFAAKTGSGTTSSNAEVVRFARVLVLAVKPDHVAELLEEIRPFVTPGHPRYAQYARVGGGFGLGLRPGHGGHGGGRGFGAQDFFVRRPRLCIEGSDAGCRNGIERQRSGLRLFDD